VKFSENSLAILNLVCFRSAKTVHRSRTRVPQANSLQHLRQPRLLSITTTEDSKLGAILSFFPPPPNAGVRADARCGVKTVKWPHSHKILSIKDARNPAETHVNCSKISGKGIHLLPNMFLKDKKNSSLIN
jgi:hypothetical protein